MASSSTSERTEQPTPKRLREARRKGQVAVSRDLASAAGFACALGVLAASLPFAARRLASTASLAIERAVSTGSLDAAAALAAVDDALWTMLSVSLPIGTAALAGGVVLTLLQTKALITAESFAPKPERFDPVAGIKRLFAHRTLIELGKTWLKLSAVGVAVVWAAGGEGLRTLVQSATSGPGDAILAGARVSLLAACAVAVSSVVLGGIDVLLQRWLHNKDLRMTKDDVRRDHKEEEGDPHVKNARKQIHRELALSTMLRNTRTASFVAVNPTHLAVAVAWDESRDSAPRIVAKGAGEAARRIRREGEWNGVRIVRDKPLARALYAVPTEAEIPEALYVAVAETLAFIANETADALADRVEPTTARSLASRSLPGTPESGDQA